MGMTWEGGQAVSEKDAGGGIYSKLTITSDGWSGVPVDGTQGDPELRKFQFDIEMTAYPTADPTAEYHLKTLEHSYGYTRQFQESHPVIVGISLEHMGFIPYGGTNPDLGENQFLGWSAINSFVGAWGGLTTDQNPTLSAQYGNLNVYGYEFSRPNYSGQSLNVEFANVGAGDNYYALKLITQDIGNWPRHSETVIKTDLPIFATDADLMTYVNSGGTDTSKILNIGDVPTPEEEYEEATKYWYVKNRFGHNTRNGSAYTGYRNYRFYKLNMKKICFVRQTPTENSPYTLKLYNYTGYTRKVAGAYGSDDSDYTVDENAIIRDYLSRSIQFADDNFYTVFQFQTNIPIFGTEQDAEDYKDELIDITSAENWQDIARIYDDVIRPPYGDEDAGNDNGTNGQSYVQGVRMWVLTSTELNTFFSDIFDETKITDILHGLQLFGTNQISAIQSLMYLPLDADDIATVYANPHAINVGSYVCPNATGRYVMNNNKMIDCGGFQCVRVYNDFRDYEIQMVLQLPYIGFRDIKISDLLDKYVSFKYSVDITSGACSCHVYADGIEIACYDGNMASQRPIQSLDQQTYLSNILGAVTGVVTPLPDSISGKAGAVTQAMTGDTGGAIVSGVSNLSSVALAKTAINAYGLEQTVKDVPINTRGSFAGCLGYFAWQKIHIHTYISKSYKPSGALENIGAPSGVGGTVGMFSGFLSVTFFQIADGFTGTETELAEIYDILKQGIYL